MCLLTASLAWRKHHLDQLEQTQLAMAEQADLFIEGDFTVESLAKAGIAKPMAPVIIYASRTHSQLSQVVAELHRTAYADSLNICVLGSRSQMCIHPVVSQVKGGMGAVNRACASHVQRASCTYHSNAELFRNSIPRTKDIEDLILWGRRNSACPYYIAKDQQAIADIVFVPYNYIIDPLIRRSLTVDLQGAVVIIDEAHNLESVANDAASFDISSQELKVCLTQIQQCIELVDSPQLPQIPAGGIAARTSGNTSAPPSTSSAAPSAAPTHFKMDAEDDWIAGPADAQVLKTAIEALLKEIAETQFPANVNVKVADGKWLFDFFAKAGITGETAPGYLRTVERVTAIMTDPNSGLVQLQTPTMAHAPPTMHPSSYAAVNALSSFAECLRKMFMTGVTAADAGQHWKAVLQREQAGAAPSSSSDDHRGGEKRARGGSFASEKSYKLSFWCFYPGLAMQSLMSTGLRSLIVTSGTLSPLDSFAYELGTPFPIRLENPHVIPASQIWVGVLANAVDGEPLNSTYNKRSEQYTRSLGHTLVNIARITPGGMLVFFPSYKMMEDCLAKWHSPSTTLWAEICRYKQPVIEPRESSKLKQAMLDYYNKVDAPVAGTINGAVFFAVCRGKVSEGLDFSNNYGRSVVITGLPFALSIDQKVKLKKEYLDNQSMQRRAAAVRLSAAEASSLPKPLSGNDWYAQSAWRAVNQAIGRVIRHRNDYGAIIFADERFLGAQTQPLSKWLRPYVRHIRDLGSGFQELTKFFHTNAERVKLEATTANKSPALGAFNQAISLANARRTSVFSALDSAAKATSSTSLTSQSPGSSSKPSDDTAKKQKKDPKQLLALAKARLDATTYQQFQSKLRNYKNNRSTPRSELYAALATLLKVAPEVLDALREYLGKSLAAPSPSSTPTSSASNAEAPHVGNAAPSASPDNEKQLTKKNTQFPLPSLPRNPDAANDQSAPLPAAGPAEELPAPEETPSIELVATIPPKKRHIEHIADHTKSPPPKRPALTSPLRPARIIPSESILDISASQGASTVKPDEAESIEVISSQSSSLQFVGVLPLNAPLEESAPLPTMRRHGSNPVEADTASWIQGLTRGASGGISDAAVATPTKPAAPPKAATPLTTPKKPFVDLLTGQVGTAPWLPQRRPSPEKDSTEARSIVQVIPDSLPPTSSPQVECPICRQLSSDFRSAPCGHSCCYQCWQGWLTQKLECPFCRGRVREKKLEKVSKK